MVRPNLLRISGGGDRMPRNERRPVAAWAAEWPARRDALSSAPREKSDMAKKKAAKKKLASKKNMPKVQNLRKRGVW
jgi:hypothetical protein